MFSRGPRRRIGATTTASTSTCLILLILIFTTTASAAGSVLGIDFGTLNIKAVLVKPGIPLEIVLSKDSKRKELATVAFKPNRDSENNIVAEIGTFPERSYGGDALALQGRFPGEVFPNLKPLLGLIPDEDSKEAIEIFRERYPAIQVEQSREDGGAIFKSQSFVDKEVPWSVEELLAMEFANIRGNAEAMAGKGSTVDDVVITVPPFYTADEKRAIQRAADLAGLDVYALISDGLAVGLDYAKSRTFPEVTKGEKPEYHIVYDMGAGYTTATLLRFQSRSVKDVGKFNKTVQEVAVLGTGWNRILGGDTLTNLVLTDYIYKFLTKPVMKSRGTTADQIKANPRVMSRLWKEAERARQVLSANTETSSSFEELLPDFDFKVKLTRSEFENIASDFVKHVTEPIEDALETAKLGMKDIDSIILHGGAVRTPFVQKRLEAIAGGSSKLRSNVNADESAVFGAAFKGAGLSPSFKVKEIRDSDVAGYPVGMTYTDGGKERKQVLFNAASPVGQFAATKQISFKDKDDFSFSFYQQVRDSERAVVQIETLNLTAGVKQLKSKFGCEKDGVSTKLNIKLNPADGVPMVVSGSVSCEVEGDAKADSLGESVKDWLGFGKKKNQEPLQGGEEEAETVETTETVTSLPSSASATVSASSSASKAPETPKKRTESVGIEFKTTPLGSPQPSAEEVKRMRDRLAAFDRSDQARREREEAVNVLESYTYHVRDFLDNSDYQEVSTAPQRDSISKVLASTRDFMENPREIGAATDAILSDKLKALQNLVEPIKARRQEALIRPEKVAGLRASLEQTDKLVQMVREQIEKSEEAKKKAQELRASRAAAATESSTADAESDAAANDDLADLEEPDSTKLSDVESTPSNADYDDAAELTAFTIVDLTELSELHATVTAWLKEKEAEQAKLKPFEEPTLRVEDIEKKVDQLGEVTREMLFKQMRNVPKPTKSKSSKTSKTKSSKKKKRTSSGHSSGEEQPTGAGERPASVTLNTEDMLSEGEMKKKVFEAIQRQKDGEKSTSHVIDEL